MPRRSKSIRAAARGPSTSDQSVTARGSPPPAEVVANEFVQLFYHILHKSPEVVYRFYNESSKLGRPNPDGGMDYATTMQAINEKILAMDYSVFRAEIKTVDAQESHNSGITVLVTGSLTGKDMVKKGFTQTFFLATQDTGYFVLNDICRVSAQGSSMASDQLIQPVAAGSLPPAQMVGNAFVQQFYHIHKQSPKLMYHFYKEGSKVGRPDHHGIMHSVSTIQAIEEKMLAVDYSKFSAEIKTVDTQESLNGGLIILVTGYHTGKVFTQCFFLAPQEKGYFVLNDIIRYVDEDAHQLRSISLAIEPSHHNHRSENSWIPPALVGAAAAPTFDPLHVNFNTPSTLAPTHSPVSEDVQLAMAIDASIQSAIAEGVPLNPDSTDVRIKRLEQHQTEDSKGSSSKSTSGVRIKRVEQPQTEDSKGSSSKGTSGSCVICLDAQVEGACIPCGHMAGCMTCLNKIKRKNWGCPVCRAKIDQVVRIYAV